MKNIAIIGSSGGNLYNLGGKEPYTLIDEIIKQAHSAGIEVSHLIFIGANTSMDRISKTTLANLYYLDKNKIRKSETNVLNNINAEAIEIDKQIAQEINEGRVDGIVFVSPDPTELNHASTQVAVDKQIPVVGTGGTSMAIIQSMGANVVAISGTTGTTNRTRAISAISSLAKAFNLKYTPIVGDINDYKNINSSIKDRISIRGIMMASLPGFISMAIILALSRIPGFEDLQAVFDIIIGILPIIVATIAAYQISGLNEVGLVSGIIGGALSQEGGVIGGIIGGVLAGIIAIYLIRLAFQWKIPATTANILAGGISGLLAGLLVYYFIAPFAIMLGDGIRELIQVAVNFNPIIAGALAGAIIWPAIIGGVYHAAILPIVLLEMEAYGMSFLGAIDMVGLVMVSAGITLGNVLFPMKREDRSIALPGFIINVVFGTFVEASYPFMLSNKIIFFGSLISGTIVGGLIGLFNVQGTAYVPSIVAPALSNNPLGMGIAMTAGLLLGLIFTYISNKATSKEIVLEEDVVG